MTKAPDIIGLYKSLITAAMKRVHKGEITTLGDQRTYLISPDGRTLVHATDQDVGISPAYPIPGSRGNLATGLTVRVIQPHRIHELKLPRVPWAAHASTLPKDTELSPRKITTLTRILEGSKQIPADEYIKGLGRVYGQASRPRRRR